MFSCYFFSIYFVIDNVNQLNLKLVWNSIFFPTGYGGSYQRCSIKKGVLNNFPKFNERQLRQNLFFNKLPEASTFIKKETLAQVFSSEFCEIFKNTFFTEHCRTLRNFLRTLEDCFYAWIVRDVFGTLSNVWDAITLAKSFIKDFWQDTKYTSECYYIFT